MGVAYFRKPTVDKAAKKNLAFTEKQTAEAQKIINKAFRNYELDAKQILQDLKFIVKILEEIIREKEIVIFVKYSSSAPCRVIVPKVPPKHIVQNKISTKKNEKVEFEVARDKYENKKRKRMKEENKTHKVIEKSAEIGHSIEMNENRRAKLDPNEEIANNYFTDINLYQQSFYQQAFFTNTKFANT
ncbi:hypothetical protein C2G38_2151044 [Gigaspora rosea]|uniref:Uncharacterized protein n=1 Tax=Gigaspora rosea TaxID=44941 RepID=A0A397W8C4_9GLOM|nr:hypothetical protein C2G38_2151044 [Gigaspora rosea]